MVLIHIGYHKTATTWLQRQLFVPDHGFRRLMTHQDVHDAIVKPSTLLGDNIGRASWQSADPGSATPVVSSEILCGNPLTGGREAGLYARRLQRLFPTGQVLIVIREQRDAIASTYMQYVRRAGTKTVAQFLAQPAVPGYFDFPYEHFEYHRLIQTYISIFGSHNVIVMNFEHLVRNGKDFVRQIAEFARRPHLELDRLNFGVEGGGDPEALCFVLRRINHFRGDAAHPEPVLNLGRAASVAYRTVSFAGRRVRRLQHIRPVRDEVSRILKFDYGPSNAITRTLVARPEFMERYAT